MGWDRVPELLRNGIKAGDRGVRNVMELGARTVENGSKPGSQRSEECDGTRCLNFEKWGATRL